MGYSDSRGIVTVEGKRVDSINSASNTTHTMVSRDYFMPHPAFLDGTENEFENGEWDEELEGIWVGKFENSKTNATSTSAGNTSIIKVQPGVKGWRYVDIENMNAYSIAYCEELQSHVLKNSEWGAVAYLTESAYGRNGTEIEHNGGDFVTGGGAEKAYIELNQAQSTTGNVYGIYDLSGCSYERMYAYYSEEKSTKYSTTYGYDSNGNTGSNASKYYKYGDATFETSGWHSDLENFSTSWVCRGGNENTGKEAAGIFNYYYDLGYSASKAGFRMALAI